jgi:predicted O-methyltransferase YrrM
MNLSDINDTQTFDHVTGTLFPWYTKPFLENLSQWNLSEATILEFGGGWSTIWYSKKAKRVVTIETNRQWHDELARYIFMNHITNVILIYKDINEGDQMRKDEYTGAADYLGLTYNIICVDGILRNECLEYGIRELKKTGGIIIADNIYQDYVWLSPAAVEMMKGYEQHIFVQPDHTNHEGNPWKSGYYMIKKEKSAEKI